MSEKKYRKSFYETYVSEKVRKDRSDYSIKDYESASSNILRNISGWLPENKKIKILDIGCGNGSFLYLFKKLGYYYLTGIDISKEQIDIAKEFLPGVTLIEGDLVEFLKAKPGDYDLITAFDVIEHFSKDEIVTILDLINKTLKPNGVLILQTPNAESPWFGSVGFGDFTHEWFFTPQSLDDVLRKNGFKNCMVKPSSPDVHSFLSFFRVCIWFFINIFLKVWNLSETGSKGSGIYTRVFLARAEKK